MESIIIGIAGGSGSGKSTFTNRIKKHFGDDVVVIYHDNYYRRREDPAPYFQRCGGTRQRSQRDHRTVSDHCKTDALSVCGTYKGEGGYRDQQW